MVGAAVVAPRLPGDRLHAVEPGLRLPGADLGGLVGEDRVLVAEVPGEDLQVGAQAIQSLSAVSGPGVSSALLTQDATANVNVCGTPAVCRVLHCAHVPDREL